MSDGFDWQQVAGLTGLLTAATAVLSWVTGRRLQRSAVTHADAEAEKFRVETERQRVASGAEFEAAVNERVKLIFEEQNRRIAEMAEEIRLLRSQVEKLTRETEEVHLLRGQVETLTRELQRAKQALGRAPAILAPATD